MKNNLTPKQKTFTGPKGQYYFFPQATDEMLKNVQPFILVVLNGSTYTVTLEQLKMMLEKVESQDKQKSKNRSYYDQPEWLSKASKGELKEDL